MRQVTLEEVIARKSTMLKQRPGASEQVVVTPKEFIQAVESRWGPLTFDLAATFANTQAPGFYSPEADSLKQDWSTLSGVLWLNPPFGKTPEAPHGLADWTAKAASTKFKGGTVLLMLCPASVGASWFSKNVWGKARIVLLTGRITLTGHLSAYPKDCCILEYGCGMHSVVLWDWRGGP